MIPSLFSKNKMRIFLWSETVLHTVCFELWKTVAYVIIKMKKNVISAELNVLLILLFWFSVVSVFTLNNYRIEPLEFLQI